MPNRLIYFSLLALPFLLSCSGSGNDGEEEDVVARAFDKKLYNSELQEMIPEDVSGADSVLLADNYINNWVRQQLILRKAELNLNEEQKNVEQQLEDYRNSLLIYLYEREFVRQKLDTVVSEEEIEKYYNENKQNFELKDNIVKALYVKLDKDLQKVNKVKKWMKSNDSKDRKKLEEYCVQHAEKYFFDDDNWIFFDDLLKEVPLSKYNGALVLRNNKSIEVEDSAFVYLVSIKEFQVKDSTSPLSFEQDNIRNIIINKRKLELVKQMEEEIFDEAIEENYFEIYNEN